jgi:hypothetical protein
MMLVVDEHTGRKYLAIEVKRSISGEHVIKTMTYLFRDREAFGLIHSDKGSEFMAVAAKR